MFGLFKRRNKQAKPLTFPYVIRYGARVESDHPVHSGRSAVVSCFKQSPEGNPQGGWSDAQGISVVWQDGVQEPNGAIMEDLLEIAINRMEFFQDSKFACRENALVITKLQEAKHWLEHRTKNRRARGVEGTYNA